MSLTRAQLEAITLKRVGNLMAEAGLDVEASGVNADLNDPIGWGLRQLGYSTSPAAVTSAEVAAVDAAHYDQLFDLAEYRALLNIMGNLLAFDVQVGPRRESLNQIRLSVEQLVSKKIKWLELNYGFGLGTLTAGVIALDFTDNDNLA